VGIPQYLTPKVITPKVIRLPPLQKKQTSARLACLVRKNKPARGWLVWFGIWPRRSKVTWFGIWPRRSTPRG